MAIMKYFKKYHYNYMKIYRILTTGHTHIISLALLKCPQNKCTTNFQFPEKVTFTCHLLKGKEAERGSLMCNEISHCYVILNKI